MSSTPVEPTYVTSPRDKKLGLCFLIGPLAGLVLIMVAWAMTSFMISRSMVTTPTSEVVSSSAAIVSSVDLRTTVARIINVALGFLGILSVIGIIIGIPLGIIFLVRKTLDPSRVEYDKRSGKGGASVIPEEIRGWNWGAAGLPFIWGVYHHIWISLLKFVPFVGLIWWIVMGIKGNEWAWRKNDWVSVAQFKETQRKWMPWGIAFFVLSVLMTFVQLGQIAGTLAALSVGGK
ncbi:MAG: hypothetical protein Q7N87_01390 [Candidatus Uhrbacteria bacterium]|nr:hypothetical protein [Candidatus Uhrbacteria bacterium]